MIIDSHCHAWTHWPYQPPVPDAESRPRVEQLLNEMDLHGVDQAAIVCAQIDHNPANNAYIAEQVARFPKRLHQIADVDSSWSATYHQPGAAQRLQQTAARWPIKGFTHYLKHDDDGAWLYSAEGLAFFKVAEEKKLIASIACAPHHQPAIRKVAAQFPSVPFLIHHLGGVKVNEAAPRVGLQQVVESARVENIFIKLSGFAYATAGPKWDFPYSDTHELIRAEYEHYGPRRMCWGSDYPVVRFYMTYRQALEAFRTYCDFIPATEHAWILGNTLQQLLAVAGSER
ncbi:MAG: amidohydrolase family protein [Caldilineaceae bacterium]|nr:amidohydrolase family protein [Caldilineaceae bacterium]MCB9157867.1 amidohydrolase family protein [Caldilineaceae bacterium]